MEAMAEGVATVISLATRNILKCKKQMLEDVTMISGDDTACMLTKHKLAVAALLVISTTVKEPTGFEWMFVEEDVDRTELFKVANTEERLAAIMAAYWLFGIAYGKKIYNTACLLERICLMLSFTPLRAVAIKVVNKMLKN
ncbi:hypothetical protein HPB47_004254 [Ixodes persulcatus]|uniref:Uncharacterized protein n=1 Tax=Ixodes persulcatus TaxID=34615 RepID=A0AC60PG78_IXOPE|nr:hypothetical protein HPB47_004254 [Ixodes persulcatus]